MVLQEKNKKQKKAKKKSMQQDSISLFISKS